MSGLFKNILVPADFSDNTEIAIREAVGLGYGEDSIIHLLHVIRPKNPYNINSFSNKPVSKRDEAIKKSTGKLQEWKQSIEKTGLPNTVSIYVMKGTVEGAIEDLVKKVKPQLIIIGKRSNRRYIPFVNRFCPNRLAKATGCPVLTVMRGTTDTKIKTIVIPVRSFIPKRKIELAVEFAKVYRAEIHLVAMPDGSTAETGGSSFLETYRILTTSLTNSIDYHLLRGHNFPKAILDYARRVRADLLFVNPGSETKISAFTGKHIQDELKSSGNLKIMSLEPYHNSKQRED